MNKDDLPEAPIGQTWVYLNYPDGPRWELRGTGAIISIDQKSDYRQEQS